MFHLLTALVRLGVASGLLLSSPLLADEDPKKRALSNLLGTRPEHLEEVARLSAEFQAIGQLVIPGSNAPQKITSQGAFQSPSGRYSPFTIEDKLAAQAGQPQLKALIAGSAAEYFIWGWFTPGNEKRLLNAKQVTIKTTKNITTIRVKLGSKDEEIALEIVIAEDFVIRVVEEVRDEFTSSRTRLAFHYSGKRSKRRLAKVTSTFESHGESFEMALESTWEARKFKKASRVAYPQQLVLTRTSQKPKAASQSVHIRLTKPKVEKSSKEKSEIARL